MALRYGEADQNGQAGLKRSKGSGVEEMNQ